MASSYLPSLKNRTRAAVPRLGIVGLDGDGGVEGIARASRSSAPGIRGRASSACRRSGCRRRARRPRSLPRGRRLPLRWDGLQLVEQVLREVFESLLRVGGLALGLRLAVERGGLFAAGFASLPALPGANDLSHEAASRPAAARAAESFRKRETSCAYYAGLIAGASIRSRREAAGRPQLSGRSRKADSALLGLEARVGLVDDVNAALAAHDFAVAVAALQRLERGTDFHGANAGMSAVAGAGHIPGPVCLSTAGRQAVRAPQPAANQP